MAPIYFPFFYKAYILLKYSFLWNQNDQVSFDYFRLWVKKHPDATEMTKWLLMEHMTVSLSDDTDTPTFYQTLAGVTHCKFKHCPLLVHEIYTSVHEYAQNSIFFNRYLVEETDISELEKRYWTLKSQSKSGKFDLDTFKAMVCPPVPEAICESKCIVKGFLNFKTMMISWNSCIYMYVEERRKKIQNPNHTSWFTRRFLSLAFKENFLDLIYRKGKHFVSLDISTTHISIHVL